MIIIKTTVVNMKNELFDIRIDKLSEFTNPFETADPSDKEREQAYSAYEKYFWKTNLGGRLHKLIGKRLGCWCAPKKCHGNFLADEANMLDIIMTTDPSWTMPEPGDKVKIYWFQKDIPFVKVGTVVSIHENTLVLGIKLLNKQDCAINITKDKIFYAIKV